MTPVREVAMIETSANRRASLFNLTLKRGKSTWKLSVESDNNLRTIFDSNEKGARQRLEVPSSGIHIQLRDRPRLRIVGCCQRPIVSIPSQSVGKTEGHSDGKPEAAFNSIIPVCDNRFRPPEGRRPAKAFIQEQARHERDPTTSGVCGGRYL